MIEVWTEDSGAGYKLIKSIIRVVYGAAGICVIPHEGNGDDVPTKDGSHGGILYDLKNNRMSQRLIVLIPDMALDNPDVNESLLKIKEEIALNHRGIRRIIPVYCFEYLMLSYKNLRNYGAFDGGNIEKEVNAYINAFSHRIFSRRALLKNQHEIGRRLLTNEYITGEQIGKRLLSAATNKCNIHTKNRNIRGAIIQGNLLGVCWACECCRYYESAIKLDCDTNIRKSIPKLDDKIHHLITNSAFSDCIKHLDNEIYNELKRRYVKDNSKYNGAYADTARNFLNIRSNAVKFLDYLGVERTWSDITVVNFIRRSAS